MPPTVVKPITVGTFEPYAKLGKSNSKIQSRICELLFKLIQTDNPKKVKALCESEIEWLEAEYDKPSTRTSYVSAYRKAIRAYFNETGIPINLTVEKQTVKGSVVNHLAESFLLASPEDYDAVKQTSKTKTATQRDNLVGFNAADALEATEQALCSADWREVAVGLIMASQSRPSDILQSGEFKAISQYRLEFSSRAKKRGAIATGEIFCLVDTPTFIDAFSQLRREADVIEMRGWSLKDVDSAKNKTLNRAVTRIYGDIIPVPYGEKELSCKNLRAAGVNVAYWLHGRDSQSLGRFAELQLLHKNPGTAANYEDYFCVDEQGDRLREVGIFQDAPLAVEPLSEKRSSLSLDKQLLSMVSDAERWGEGSHADRLERIIARAEIADRLERQLARECEKRQGVELELKRLQSANKSKSVVGSEPVQVKETAIAEPSGFDWRSMPNAELNGNRRHDAFTEKLRRSFEAVQESNAGLDDSEQFAVTGSLLRQLTGVKPGLVKQWMEENKAALDSYNAGYGMRQNTGKPEPKLVIKWSEAYGKYEW